MITITDNAVIALKKLLSETEENEDKSSKRGLRLGVDRGGCAGFQYVMRVACAEEGDCLHEEQGVCILIDKESLPYVKGSSVDYEDTLSDSGFKIINPNAARSCGCGTSFEPEGESAASATSKRDDSGEECKNSTPLEKENVEM